MNRRPPTSPLFPYTTLFRSLAAGLVLAGVAAPALDTLLARRLEPRLDRKSTRLNSSHQIISYAVFCLKKNINCLVSVLRMPDMKFNHTIFHTLPFQLRFQAR